MCFLVAIWGEPEAQARTVTQLQSQGAETESTTAKEGGAAKGNKVAVGGEEEDSLLLRGDHFLQPSARPSGFTLNLLMIFGCAH